MHRVTPKTYFCALLNGVLDGMLHIQAAGAAAEVHVERDVAAAEASNVAGNGDRL